MRPHKLKWDLTGGGQDNNLLYLSGLPHSKVASPEIINKVVELVEQKIKEIEMVPLKKIKDISFKTR